jgi:cysteine synthase
MLIKSTVRNEGLEQIINLFESGLPSPRLAPPPEDVRTSEWYLDYKLEGVAETWLVELGMIPTGNGKALAATRIFLEKLKQGVFDDYPEVDLSSSGNFAASAGYVGKFLPIRRINAAIDKKIPPGKRRQLEFAGVNPVDTPEGKSPIQHAHELAQQPGHVEVNQYIEQGSIDAQEWLANHITRCCMRLGKTPTLFGAVTGTRATVVGGKKFLARDFPNIKIFGVASMYTEGDKEDREKVAGSRSLKGLRELEGIEGFELEKALDFPLVASVPKKRAIRTNVELIRRWHPVGPTGALLVAGNWDLVRDICLGKFKDRGITIDSVKNERGQVISSLPVIDAFQFYAQDREYDEPLHEVE